MKEDPNMLFLFERLKERIRIKSDLIKLNLAESISATITHLISRGVVITIAVILMVFGSIALAVYLGKLFDSLWLGFLTVSVIYLLIGIIIYFSKEGLEKSLKNVFIRKILKNTDHEQTEEN